MIKLHLGCGNMKLQGYLNIDIRQTPATDMIGDIRALKFEPESVDEILGYHVIEHMTYQDAIRSLSLWHCILKKGSRLILEWPDLEKICRSIIMGCSDDILHLYGANRFPYDMHQWGYTEKTMKELLEKIGFTDIKVSEGTDYHIKECPCLRVEGNKK